MERVIDKINVEYMDDQDTWQEYGELETGQLAEDDKYVIRALQIAEPFLCKAVKITPYSSEG